MFLLHHSAFKFLPILGECMSKAITKSLPPNLVKEWRFRSEYFNRSDVFLGDGSRGGPARRELEPIEKARLEPCRSATRARL